MSVKRNYIDQKEYLKKYLSGDKKKKKKHKKNKAAPSKLKIIDDNIDNVNNTIDEELLMGGEDCPQIVGEIIVEDEAQVEVPKPMKWRNIAVKEEPGEHEVSIKKEPTDDDKWGRAAIKNENVLEKRQIKAEPKSDSDLSPPRKRKDKQAQQLSNKPAKVDADSDLDIPRRRRHGTEHNRDSHRDADSDLDIPRRRRNDSPVRIDRQTSSQQRRNHHHDSDSDLSPPRKRRNSPDAKHTSKTQIESPRRIKAPHIKREKLTPPKITQTLDGKKAGLQNAKDLRVENQDRQQAEERLFAQMSNEVSGQNAELAVRLTGRKGRRAREAEEDPEERKRREQREKEKKELYDRWGKGLKQVEDRRMQLEEQIYESSKPLARYADDADLDRYLREQERFDDPMLNYMREKKQEQAQRDNVPIMPKYKGSFVENRFGIPPGYRWDGVDRSNGYEKRWFEVRNEKRAREEEAYKYSVEDM